MIGVMRDWLNVPENEKRILSAIKRQRINEELNIYPTKLSFQAIND